MFGGVLEEPPSALGLTDVSVRTCARLLMELPWTTDWSAIIMVNRDLGGGCEDRNELMPLK